MTYQNRVTPFGDIVATQARGAFMGNRGILHDERQEIVRPYKSKAWIICRLAFKGWPTEVVLTPAEDGVLTESAVNLDNLQTVPKARLGGLIAILSPNKIEIVERAICFALGMDHLL